MDADEILWRSRESGHYEGQDFITNQGDQLGFFALCLAILLLTIYRTIKGRSIGDAPSLPFIFLSAGMFARHQRERDRFTLTFGIVTAIAAPALLLSFVIMTW